MVLQYFKQNNHAQTVSIGSQRTILEKEALAIRTLSSGFVPVGTAVILPKKPHFDSQKEILFAPGAQEACKVQYVAPDLRFSPTTKNIKTVQKRTL
jgi:hypothetical protein